MKLAATLVLLFALASPVAAATLWDETSAQGDLSSNAAAPTLIAPFAPGGKIIGSVSNIGGNTDRDYITFTVNPGEILDGLTLTSLSPDNLAFCAFNSGSTSFVPSTATNGSFLAGIHVNAADVGFDLMPFFANRVVTTHALSSPFLGPGTYCFVIQQTSPITTSYVLDFHVSFVLPVHEGSWGRVQSLYR